MSTTQLTLANAPIVEAVVDLDCDMRPEFELSAILNSAADGFRTGYPNLQKQILGKFKIESGPEDGPTVSSDQCLNALQFRSEDGKQLVQVRSHGFSFNRLAPYSSFDDYLPEVQRTWELFLRLAAPVQLRAVRLRYINRIALPLNNEPVDLDHYFKVSPKLPDEDALQFLGFLNQHTVIEKNTGHEATIVLASQPPLDGVFPIIFDITVGCAAAADPADWTWISAKLDALRDLKNRIFKNTVTERCLTLFQQSD